MEDSGLSNHSKTASLSLASFFNTSSRSAGASAGGTLCEGGMRCASSLGLSLQSFLAGGALGTEVESDCAGRLGGSALTSIPASFIAHVMALSTLAAFSAAVSVAGDERALALGPETSAEPPDVLERGAEGASFSASL